MDWEPEQYQPALPEAPSGPNWRAIFIGLLIVIVVLGVAIWRLSTTDDDETVATDDTETVEPDDDTPNSDAPDDSPDGETTEGDNGENGEATDGTTSTTAPDTTTTVPISTTTYTTTVPPNADEYGPTTLTENSSVSTIGLGSVSFGMTVQDAQEAAGTLMIPINPVSNCYHVVPHDAPEGIVFLVYSGTLERVDINSGPITTRSGVGIGALDETIISLFGDSIERAVRPDGTIDLIFVPKDEGDADFRVVFNVLDGNVRTFKAGRYPQVMTETGCETPQG